MGVKNIKFKRGLKSNLPNQADLGEPLFAKDTGELYVGQGIGLPPVKINSTIDDTNTSNDKLWSSGKMNNELMNKSDVNHIHEDLGGGISLSQVTKLNVIATTETPKIINIDIPYTLDFNRPPIEILKLEQGNINTMITQCDFDNDDETDFNAGDQIEFDGKMQLKTNYTIGINEETQLTNSNVYSVDLNSLTFKSIEKIILK